MRRELRLPIWCGVSLTAFLTVTADWDDSLGGSQSYLASVKGEKYIRPPHMNTQQSPYEIVLYRDAIRVETLIIDPFSNA
jgi:hypothetical protein